MASAAWVFAAWNLRSPYFLLVRETVFWLWLAGGALAAAWLVCQRKTLFARLRPLHLTIFAALAGGILAGHGRWLHEQHRRRVVATPLERMPPLGRHLVIGWLGLEETRTLAAKGAIAGVFLTSRDFAPDAGLAEIRRTVDALQAARREAGLPRLWIVTDPVPPRSCAICYGTSGV